MSAEIKLICEYAMMIEIQYAVPSCDILIKLLFKERYKNVPSIRAQKIPKKRNFVQNYA